MDRYYDIMTFISKYPYFNYAKFRHCRKCVTDFREGVFLPPAQSVRSPKFYLFYRLGLFQKKKRKDFVLY